jgi:hypothetical protein
LDPKCEDILEFNSAWQKLFGASPIRKKTAHGNQQVSTFDYISRTTLLRPRDFVAYLQQCAQKALEEHSTISAGIVKRADKAFSKYLRGEFTDELGTVFPDISHIFNVISRLRKGRFSAQEFEAAYSAEVERGNVAKRNIESLLVTLFLFSVVGNITRTGFYFFRFSHKDATFNVNEPIVLHRGLFKALEIL